MPDPIANQDRTARATELYRQYLSCETNDDKARDLVDEFFEYPVAIRREAYRRLGVNQGENQ